MSPPPPLLTERLNQMLSKRDYPKTICPSEVARSMSTSELRTLGIDTWRDLMPQLRNMAFEARDRGEVEVLQRGEVVSIEIENVRGPIRIRLMRSNDEANN
ncbi:hypothetical protein H2200_011440 [Cladophialophora chaetospira]|uniref:Uncharacterized protein n=1 Tax=Cladophialophora chaetospira TaxID=386627 RepID=A0AA38WZC6_9EURO|nr:hypothetical protein H2200_011440 [Cladophialophora chaetospira]